MYLVAIKYLLHHILETKRELSHNGGADFSLIESIENTDNAFLSTTLFTFI